MLIGSPDFWHLYDSLCLPEALKRLIEHREESDLVLQMRTVMRETHASKNLHRLMRPERGWTGPRAWLALGNAPMRNLDNPNQIVNWFRTGDVLVVEFGWDRDVIITHSPIERNLVSGYILGSKQDEMIGLFMPLYEASTIHHCIKLRLARNTREAIELAEQEALDWNWH